MSERKANALPSGYSVATLSLLNNVRNQSIHLENSNAFHDGFYPCTASHRVS